MSKSSSYKNYKYKRFVEDIRDRPLKNKSAKEQYEEIYKFVQQESAKNEEDTYTFAKRYLSNTHFKYQDVNLFMSLLLGWLIGNIIQTTIWIAIIVFIICCVALFVDTKTMMLTRNIENDEIILTVLEDYCKEVEQTFRQKGETNE